MKAGKPVLACFGPTNEPADRRMAGPTGAGQPRRIVRPARHPVRQADGALFGRGPGVRRTAVEHVCHRHQGRRAAGAVRGPGQQAGDALQPGAPWPARRPSRSRPTRSAPAWNWSPATSGRGNRLDLTPASPPAGLLRPGSAGRGEVRTGVPGQRRGQLERGPAVPDAGADAAVRAAEGGRPGQGHPRREAAWSIPAGGRRRNDRAGRVDRSEGGGGQGGEPGRGRGQPAIRPPWPRTPPCRPSAAAKPNQTRAGGGDRPRRPVHRPRPVAGPRTAAADDLQLAARPRRTVAAPGRRMGIPAGPAEPRGRHFLDVGDTMLALPGAVRRSSACWC